MHTSELISEAIGATTLMYKINRSMEWKLDCKSLAFEHESSFLANMFATVNWNWVVRSLMLSKC